MNKPDYCTIKVSADLLADAAHLLQWDVDKSAGYNQRAIHRHFETIAAELGYTVSKREMPELENLGDF